MTRAWPALLALLVAVCGGYFALAPFMRALNPAPQFGTAATVSSAATSVPAIRTQVARSNRLVNHQLRAKPKAKKPAHKPATHRPATTVPTKPIFVNHPLRQPTSSGHTTVHTPAPTPHHSSTPAPTRSRGPIVSHSPQGSGLASRGGSSSTTVTGGTSSSPARP